MDETAVCLRRGARVVVGLRVVVVVGVVGTGVVARVVCGPDALTRVIMAVALNDGRGVVVEVVVVVDVVEVVVLVVVVERRMLRLDGVVAVQIRVDVDFEVEKARVGRGVVVVEEVVDGRVEGRRVSLGVGSATGLAVIISASSSSFLL